MKPHSKATLDLIGDIALMIRTGSLDLSPSAEWRHRLRGEGADFSNAIDRAIYDAQTIWFPERLSFYHTGGNFPWQYWYDRFKSEKFLESMGVE